MKKILITTNVKFSKKRGFVFSLEKNWSDYSRKLKFNLISCNYDKTSFDLIKFKKIDGVIFSGGNDLQIFDKKKENIFRDKNEKKIFNLAILHKIPILAVCRGYQLIASIFNHKLIYINNHIKKNHTIYISNNSLTSLKKINVNSFHNYAVINSSKNFEIIGKHKDETIEVIYSKKKNILCLMFHPERKNISQKIIDNLISKHLNL